MRYLFGFLYVCALGVVPLVGCQWDFLRFEDLCEGVVCSDDGNECTREFCTDTDGSVRLEYGTCKSSPLTGTDCDFDGLAGLCVDGECKESPCGVCDDDNLCTEDWCSYVDERCVFSPVQCFDLNQCTEATCNPLDGCNFTPVEDGTPCFNQDRWCQVGVCVAPCDPASEEILPCPVEGTRGLLCCPGGEYCGPSCDVGAFEVQP